MKQIGFSLTIVLAALLFTTRARAEGEPPQVTSDRPAPAPTAEEEKPEHIRIGAIGGVGFPRPLSIEAMVKLEKTVALGLEYGVMPTLKISNVETKLHAISADARWFPFRGSFFVGLRAGRQTIEASATTSVASLGTATASVSVETWFVNPRVGLLWTWDSGFTVGMEAGVQLPVSTTGASSIPSGNAVGDQIASVTQTLGGTALPTIDLLRVGFLF